MKLLRLTAVLVFALGSGGCFLFGGRGDGGDDGPDRCEQDRYDCQDTTEVPQLPDCEPEGELTLQLGQGLNEFEPLMDGEPLDLVSGSGGFQGPSASHAVLGVAIKGAALDQYSVLGARFEVFESSACSELPDGPLMCEGVAWIGNRQVLLGDGPALNVVGDTIEEFGITMPIDTGAAGERVLQAVVEDPCGRIGVAHHRY